MSKKLSDQDSGDKSRIDKIDKELESEEQHEQVTFSLHFNPSYCEQKIDQPGDVLEEYYNDLFSEDYNQQDVITNSTIDGFQEYSILPIYDEYRDDYMDSLPEQLAKDLACSWSFIRKN